VRYRITHTTRYVYAEPTHVCHNEARLIPRDCAGQVLLGSRLSVEPEPSAYRERKDFFGNTVSYFSVQRPHSELSVKAVTEVEVDEAPPLPVPAPLAWERAVEQIRGGLDGETLEARGMVLDSPLAEALLAARDYARTSFPTRRPLLEAVQDLNARIHRDFAYDPGYTTVTTPLTEVLDHRRGVCQDFSHLAIACLRSMGLAARYVSGYLETVPPEGETRLEGADASHAWFSAYHPGAGWLDFDPTNDQRPDSRYITLAWGRDYGDVPPLKGVIYGDGAHQLYVGVDVRPLPATPEPES
jgi:transglutaminase-like putative cysteine protease